MRQFFHVPQRVHNALMIMLNLADQPEVADFVSLAEIAKRTGMSPGFLEEVVAPLRQAKLVSGKRGAAGGYRLARPADEISVGDIISAVEGPLAMVECLGSGCAASRRCQSMRVWQTVQGHLEDSLAAISLADVMNGV